MTSLLPALAAHLAALGHGVYSETEPYPDDAVAIALGIAPAGPDRCVTLSGYPSTPAPGSSNEAEQTEVVQLVVRGTPDERVSREHCQAIHDDLHGQGHLELAGGLLVLNIVARQGGPLDQGTDANNRHRHATTMAVEYLRPSALRPAQ